MSALTLGTPSLSQISNRHTYVVKNAHAKNQRKQTNKKAYFLFNDEEIINISAN